MRDPRHAGPHRGGIASSLNEIARQSQVCLEINESAIKVKPGVAAACEALGLDVFKVANEGKMLIFVAPADAAKALALARESRYGQDAEIIGEVKAAPSWPGAGAHHHRHRPHPGPAFGGTFAADLLREFKKWKMVNRLSTLVIWPNLQPY